LKRGSADVERQVVRRASTTDVCQHSSGQRSKRAVLVRLDDCAWKLVAEPLLELVIAVAEAYGAHPILRSRDEQLAERRWHDREADLQPLAPTPIHGRCHAEPRSRLLVDAAW
jgi:hypothetical protein